MDNRDGDFITINTELGEKKEAELISRFTMEGYGDYIIYRLNNEFFGAKYEVDGDNTKLITDLSDIEKNALNEVFSSLEVE